MFSYGSRKAFVLLTLLSLLTIGLFVGGTRSVHAAAFQACTNHDAYANGGEVHWEKCKSPGSTQISGYVKDTKDDSRCAEAVAKFTNGGTFSTRACGLGAATSFNWSQPASDAQVHVSIVAP